MAYENWLFGKPSRAPSRRPGQLGSAKPAFRPTAQTSGLSAEEYFTAGASAVATTLPNAFDALSNPLSLSVALGTAQLKAVRNIAERAARNQETYARPMQIPPAPRGVSVDADMREAARRHDPLWFYNQVKRRAPWDYKYRDRDTAKYDPYGNFVYGAGGTALGLSPEVLRRMSGAAQIAGDAKKAAKEGKLQINLRNGMPWGEYPYGNKADDQPYIDLGIRYAKEKGY